MVFLGVYVNEREGFIVHLYSKCRDEAEKVTERQAHMNKYLYQHIDLIMYALKTKQTTTNDM